MQVINPPQTVQYAVIEAVYSECQSERFVIAYTTNTSLQDLIAGCRIVGVGFESRIQAYEVAKASVQYAAESQTQDSPVGRINPRSVVSKVQALLRRVVYSPALLRALSLTTIAVAGS